MARSRKRGGRRFLTPVGNPADPDGLFAYMQRYLDHIRVQGFTAQSLTGHEVNLRYFIAWCDARSLGRPHEITKPILESYQRYLHYYRKRNGQPLSLRSQASRVQPIKTFFRWLARNNLVLYNPASDLEVVRAPRRLPRYVLSAEEADAVMRQPDLSDPLGLRDRAVLEVLYSTGMRRMELANLKTHDIDAERGTVLIREGKGRKDRLVPIGERALYWIDRYGAQARPQLTALRDDRTLFLTREGEAFSLPWLSKTVSTYINRAEVGKRGSCHLFRHTMATLMLEGGADIRYIQAMLGHADLSTTEIYTRVAIHTLKAVHSATHPADSKLREAKAQRQASPDETQALAALFAALDQEAQDEAGEPC